MSLLACLIQWASSGQDKRKPGPAGWRSPTRWSRASMRLWLGANRLFSTTLLAVCCDISEGVPGREQGPFVPKQYSSITGLFFAPSRGSPATSPAMSALARGHPWTCLGQRRWLLLGLDRCVAWTKGGLSQGQGRAQGSVLSSTALLYN